MGRASGATLEDCAGGAKRNKRKRLAAGERPAVMSIMSGSAADYRPLQRRRPKGAFLAAVLFFVVCATAKRAGAAACEGAEARFAESRRALDQLDLARSEQILSAVRGSHPDCGRLLLLEGELQAAQGEAQAARRTLSEYVKRFPGAAEGYAALGGLLIQAGEYREADRLSAKALKLGLDSPEALTLRGRILTLKGELDEAERLLQQASRLAPEDPEPAFHLGTLYDRQQAHRKAAEQFRKVLEIRPADPRAWDYLALNLEPLGRIEEAEEAYKKGLQVNRGPLFDGFLDYNYGRFLMKQNRLKEAKRHLDRAVELAPRTRAVRFERAKLNMKLDRYAEARKDAERALSLPDPGKVILDNQVHYLLATIYTRLGEQEQAQKYIELVESVPPSQAASSARGR